MKKFLGMILIGMLFLISCGKEKETKYESGKGVKEVVIWHYINEGGGELGNLIEEFNKTHTDIKIKAEYIPFAEMKKRVSIGVASNALPDILIGDTTDHSAYISMGVYDDITDELSKWEEVKSYYPSVLKGVMKDEKYYGLPFASNDLALFYNKDILAKYGLEPPKTWEDVIKIADAVKKDGIYGLGMAGINNEEGTFSMIPWLYSAGGSWENIDSPESKEAFQFLKTLVDNGGMSKEVINLGLGDIQKQFSAGRLALMVNGPWQVPEFKKNNPNLNWGVTLIPAKKMSASVIGGESIGIVKGSKVRGEALVFLKYIIQKDVMTSYIDKTGYVPARKDVAEEAVFKNDPIKMVFIKQIETAEVRGPHPKWPEISRAIINAEQSILTGQKSVDEALKIAAAEIKSITGK